MSTILVFRGKTAAYTVSDAEPFAVGRSSSLYRATDPNNRVVCLKIFRDQPVDKDGLIAVDQFVQELEAHKRLQHPNILPVLDYVSSTSKDTRPFVVYEFCLGGNLHDLTRGRSFLPFTEALSILEPIAMALDFAHSAGFIHGDIKPQNILFKEAGAGPVLSDFGVSRYFPLVTTVDLDTAFYKQNSGSTLYLAPEQLAEGLQSPKSDIYSFAIVAFQLLTGGIPFDDKIPLFRHMQAKVEGKIIQPRDINPRLPEFAASALLLGLSINRKERPDTAQQFCEMLRGARAINRAVSSSNKTSGGTASSVQEKPSKPRSFWAGLDSKVKIAIITLVITTLGGIITAAINILPKLFK